LRRTLQQHKIIHHKKQTMQTSSNHPQGSSASIIDTDTSRKEDILWQIAKKRAGFKWGMAAYLAVNTFLVAVWFFTSRDHYNYFWPIWPIMGWGVGLVFHYMDAYHGNRIFSAEQEY
jgi:hypothetical protein